MSRYVENMNRHVHSRHMVEQDMDWLKEFRDDPDYPGPDAEPLRTEEAATTRPCSTSTATAA